MPKNRRKAASLLYRCLMIYENNMKKQVEKHISSQIQTTSDNLTVQAQIPVDWMERLINRSCLSRRKSSFDSKFRFLMATNMIIIFFIITYLTIQNPQGIVAGIPGFFIERYAGLNEAVEVKINEDAISGTEKEGALPTISFQFIPEGFQLSENTADTEQNQTIYYFTTQGQAYIRVLIEPAEKDFSVTMDTGNDNIITSYINNREVVITSNGREGEQTLVYVWIMKGYIINLIAYNVDPKLLDLMICGINLED